MRIAVVHSFYSSRSPSGENTVVREQVTALREAGHEVRLVARHTDEEEAKRAYAMRSGLTAAGGWGRSPENELAEFVPDVVHVHNTFPNLGTRWIRPWGARTVVTLHNYRTLCAAGTLFRDGEECTDCLQRPILPAVRHRCYRGSRAASLPLAIAASPVGGLRDLLHLPSALAALNQDMAARFRRLTTTPISVVPNFVPRLESSVDREDAWAYVGRLSSEKGVGELLASWPHGQRLVIYGDGDLGTDLRNQFAARKDVVFRGNVDRPALLAELGAYNGLVVPSMSPEGLPTVILEALALGVPTLVSENVSAGPDLETAGVALRIATTKTAFLDVAETLMRVRAAGQGMRERAVEVHKQRFSPEAWLGNIMGIYTRLSA